MKVIFVRGVRLRVAEVMIALAFLASQAPAGDKKREFYLGKRPPQTIDLMPVPEVVAEQQCPNFVFAAGMETILRQQNIPSLDQRFWVDRITGDRTCRPLPDNDRLKKLIEGEYTVEPNRRVRLVFRFTESFPAATDRLMVPLAQRRVYLLYWKGRPHVVTGITWQEMYFQTGQKIIDILRLGLVDLSAQGADRNVEFTRENGQASDLGGMFEVIAEPIETSNWKN